MTILESLAAGVPSRFSFLKEDGFRLVEVKWPGVWFRGPYASLVVGLRRRNSEHDYDVTAWLGDADRGEWFDLLELSGSWARDAADLDDRFGRRAFVVLPEGSMEKSLDSLAHILRDDLRRYLRESNALNDLAAERDIGSQMFDYQQDRPRIDEAFKARDWARLRALLEEHEGVLERHDRRRLEVARKRA